MFIGAANFGQDLNNWDLSSLLFVTEMFKNCPISPPFYTNLSAKAASFNPPQSLI
jgi:hypothetical protein